MDFGFFFWLLTMFDGSVTNAIPRNVQSERVLQKSRLTVWKNLFVIYYWSADVPVHICVTHLSLTKKTIIDYCKFLRETCLAAIIGATRFFGAPGQYVEVDETVITEDITGEEELKNNGFLRCMTAP